MKSGWSAGLDAGAWAARTGTQLDRAESRLVGVQGVRREPAALASGTAAEPSVHRERAPREERAGSREDDPQVREVHVLAQRHEGKRRENEARVEEEPAAPQGAAGEDGQRHERGPEDRGGAQAVAGPAVRQQPGPASQVLDHVPVQRPVVHGGVDGRDPADDETRGAHAVRRRPGRPLREPPGEGAQRDAARHPQEAAVRRAREKDEEGARGEAREDGVPPAPGAEGEEDRRPEQDEIRPGWFTDVKSFFE